MSVSAPPVAPHELIWGITTSVVSARALHLVATLRVADHIDAEAVGAGELASLCGVDAGALDRVLRLLETQRIFARQGGAYIHTDASRLLRSDDPRSLSGYARMMGLPVLWVNIAHMHHD